VLYASSWCNLTFGKGQLERKTPFRSQFWQERKLKKVRDDIDVISRKTLDQSDFITMLNTHDNVLHRLRMTMGRNKNITFEKAQEFIERSQQIREEIKQLNAEMCELMDWDYTPPRGFTNPFEKGGIEK
jgi:5'-3' exonuclease